jgi:hypothetical protein
MNIGSILMIRKKFFVVPVLLVCALDVVVSGCSPCHLFVHVPVPPGKAVVHIYRPNKLVGSANNFAVFADDKLIGDLNNNTYCTYISTPGRTKFWTTLSPQPPLYVDVVLEKTHYIMATYTYGAPLLKIVESTKAEKEISKCCSVQ